MLPDDNAAGSSNVDGTDQKIQVKVDGVVKEFTLEELKQQATLAAGSQKRMEEAAQIRKESTAAIRLRDLLIRMNSDASTPLTSSELEEVAMGQGLRGGQVQQFVQSCQQLYDEASRSSSSAKGGFIDTSGGEKGSNLVTWDRLDPTLQREIQDLRSRDNERVVTDYRTQLMGDLENRLDKDELFSKMIKDNPKMRVPIFEFIRKEITAAVATGGLDGDQLRNSVLQTVKTRLQELGIGQPAKGSNNLFTALGPAENPSMALTALGGSGEPPKRVDATDPKAEGVFAARLMAGFRNHLKRLTS